MRILGVLSSIATAVAAMLLAVPTASADTGACVSYLEDIGQDTSARVQICANTETIGDTISEEAALALCVPLMTATLLPQPFADRACQLAVEP
ncbi:MAG TPA: hypothetical protein VGR06_13270 [Actinophytocola sp.]|jgi:hypothetical protein|uniref:hypothetical protein n=1 Tax=Actinophytocola sp. TaxID=1872138 RepID=UPI002E04F37E|nr:hypothetical protein [Actinophytocola sp.]